MTNFFTNTAVASVLTYFLTGRIQGRPPPRMLLPSYACNDQSA